MSLAIFTLIVNYWHGASLAGKAGLIFFILLINVIVAVNMARTLLAPVSQLSMIADKVAHGDLNAQALVESDDEIGRLARAINLMTSELKTVLSDLEKRVNERTRAIETAAAVGRRLSTILDVSQLVAETVHQLQDAFQYYHVHIYLFDPQKEFLVMTGGTGEAGQKMLSQGHKIPKEKGLVGRASSTGTPILVPDTSQDPDWLPNPLLPETKSEIAIPIMIGENVLGALDVQQNKINGLTNQDLDLLQLVSSQLAVAIRNARLYESIEKRAVYERNLSLIVDRIQSTTTINDALQIAINEIESILGISCTISTATASNKDQELSQQGMLYLPVCMRGETFGYLVAATQDNLNDDIADLLEMVANRLGSHLEIIELTIQTRQALAETDALLAIIADLNAAQNYQDVLVAVTERTILRQADQSLMMCLYERPLSAGQVPEWILPVAHKVELPIEIASRYPLSAFEIIPNTIFTNQVVIIKDVATDKRLDRITRKLFQDVFRSNSSIIVPLLLADQSLGFIMGNFSEFIEFSEAQIQRLSAIAGQVAIKIQGLQLLKQAQDRAKKEQLLREVTGQINSATSTDMVLYKTAQELGRVMKQQVFVFLGKDLLDANKSSSQRD